MESLWGRIRSIQMFDGYLASAVGTIRTGEFILYPGAFLF